MNKTINIHYEYADGGINEDSVDKNPIFQFKKWFEEALEKSDLPHPEAMTLSTADAEGKPSARIILLKYYDESGFVFYTNYDSSKGKELAENPYAAMTFYWPKLERQVRISGMVEKIDERISDEYFKTRLRGSQIGAVVSPQSVVIDGRRDLEGKFLKLDKEFENKSIPRPPYWGGFRLAHNTIEFWQGRPDRLHDRILYTRSGKNDWTIQRLAP
ncbi:pyridoxamine 5'-phosphate oxidase [Candidatus Amoebophilus asiaticus]|nr:pyridoxamine 5'-phosphate oxidase [Candidatus Amoebophilus asiaticus]